MKPSVMTKATAIPEATDLIINEVTFLDNFCIEREAMIYATGLTKDKQPATNGVKQCIVWRMNGFWNDTVVSIKKLKRSANCESITRLLVNKALGRMANGWYHSQNTKATKVIAPVRTRVIPRAKAFLSGGMNVKPMMS